MARPKLPPKVEQRLEMPIMPPNRTLVRREVRRAIKRAGLEPVRDSAKVTITWVERDVTHSHAQISEGVMAVFKTLQEAGIVPAGCTFLDARQRLKATGPRIEVTIEGRQ